MRRSSVLLTAMTLGATLLLAAPAGAFEQGARAAGHDPEFEVTLRIPLGEGRSLRCEIVALIAHHDARPAAVGRQQAIESPSRGPLADLRAPARHAIDGVRRTTTLVSTLLRVGMELLERWPAAAPWVRSGN
jgi:hypothetical protein